MQVTVPQGATTSVARATDVLLLFTEESDVLGISEIARRLDLSKAVVHRIITTFVDRGVLSPGVGGRGYRLGPASTTLGARALRASSIRVSAQPLLPSLQRATGETSTLSALVGDVRAFIAQVESPSEIKMTVEIGRRFPLHLGSSGRCILAFQPADVIEACLAGDLSVPDDLAIDAAVLREQLQEVRRQGWSSSSGERHQGAASVAAPVFDVDGHSVGAISVCGPTERMNADIRSLHAVHVMATADLVSRAMGWRGGLPD
ncbi:IclR family transcriptional regulator [Nocardioides gilvus]|uniref:IclR family transcriptional regulator n=1 Tax=Nocardioides gilvus TaxID=1735589 RepID=UPI000D748BD1|nr:IclR family transcriptional regulator [Nocardioides gilvus]